MPEIPPRFAEAMVRAGAVNPRTGEPSLSALGRLAGLHTTTVSKFVLRGEPVGSDTLESISKALRVPSRDLLWWATGKPDRPWYPPSGSEMLTARERRILDELVRTILAAHGRL